MGTIRLYGRYFVITGKFYSDDETNAWLEENPEHGVLAVQNNVIYTARLDDRGTPVSATDTEEADNG